MPIQTRFATSIYIEKLNKSRLAKARKFSLPRFNRELAEQCYTLRDIDEEGVDWSASHYPHGYTSYGSITDLHRRFPHFEELEEMLRPHASKLARALDMDLQGGKLVMGTCWVNIMPASAAHSLHLHPLSVLSGTYYVTVPKGASAIKFEDPRLSLFMAAPPKLPKVRPLNQTFVKVAPEAGHVLLWESWLRHEVPPNASREDRISISFNYDWV